LFFPSPDALTAPVVVEQAARVALVERVAQAASAVPVAQAASAVPVAQAVLAVPAAQAVSWLPAGRCQLVGHRATEARVSPPFKMAPLSWRGRLRRR